MNLHDQALIEKINAGDYEAFEALVNLYEGKVYRLAMRMLRNQEDAEDALQETFLQVYRGLKSFEGRSNFSTWLFRLATNVCLMKIRHRETEPPTMLPLEDYLPQHEEGKYPVIQAWPEKPEANPPDQGIPGKDDGGAGKIAGRLSRGFHPAGYRRDFPMPKPEKHWGFRLPP